MRFEFNDEERLALMVSIGCPTKTTHTPPTPPAMKFLIPEGRFFTLDSWVAILLDLVGWSSNCAMHAIRASGHAQLLSTFLQIKKIVKNSHKNEHTLKHIKSRNNN